MGIEDIKKKIIADAEKERERILEEAENKAAEILENERKAAEIEKERIISQYEEEGKREYNRIITEAKMESRLKLLAVKQEGLDKVFNKAFEALRNPEYYGKLGKEYKEFLENLICKEAEGGEELILPPEDKDWIICEILELMCTDEKDETLKEKYEVIKKNFNIGVIKGGEELVLSPGNEKIPLHDEELFKKYWKDMFSNNFCPDLAKNIRFEMGKIVLCPQIKRENKKFLKRISDRINEEVMESINPEITEEGEIVIRVKDQEKLMEDYDFLERIKNRLSKREKEKGLRDDFDFHMASGLREIILSPKGAHLLIEIFLKKEYPRIYRRLEKDFKFRAEKDKITLYHPEGKTVDEFLEELKKESEELEKESEELGKNFEIEKNEITPKPERKVVLLDNLISKALYGYLTIPTDDSLTDTDKKWIIPGGFILRRGNIDINQKFDQYKNDIKYDIEAEVAKKLFPGDTK